MNPDICPSALDEDGTLDRSNGEDWGKHKWEDEECMECGSTREPAFKCPLCEEGNVYEVEGVNTHIWVCYACPFVALEFVHDIDARNLMSYLKAS